MSEENPYHSPSTLAPSETLEPVSTYESRTEAVLAGLKRSAMFGKRAAVDLSRLLGGIWACLGVVLLVAWLTGYEISQALEPQELGTAIGLTLVSIAGAAVVGAVIGAWTMRAKVETSCQKQPTDPAETNQPAFENLHPISGRSIAASPTRITVT